MIDVDCIFAEKPADTPSARPPARRSDDFRALQDRWRPTEAERNAAAFLICRLLSHPADTEADRREGLAWALAERGAFDWLRRRMGGGDAFDGGDNRRPCACCGRWANSTGRCEAVDRGELVGRPPYTPAAFMPHRCRTFQPLAGDPDQRPGAARWPGLVRIAEAACTDTAPDAP